MATSALIFDHDGTLVDSEALHYRCWHKVAKRYGVDLSEQEYIAYHNGIPTLQNAQLLVSTYGLTISSDQLADEKRQMFAKASLQTPPPMLPSVKAALELARKSNVKIAIATGAGDDDVERSLNAQQLTPYFDAIATRSQVKHGKPAPDVYLLACERLEVSPQKAIAFEDTAAGIASAKSAGLHCFAIPNAYSIQQDLSQADQQFESLLLAVECALMHG